MIELRHPVRYKERMRLFGQLFLSLRSPRLTCVLAGWVVGLAVLACGLAEAIDFQLVNFLYRSLGARFQPSPEVVLLVVDDASLQLMEPRVGRWPWPRSCLARLVEATQGAACVGMDILLCEGDPLHPGSDRELAEALRRHGRVALVGAFGENLVKAPPAGPALRQSLLATSAGLRNLPPRHLLQEFMMPLPLFADAAGRIGHANFYPSPDNLLRAYPYLEPTDRGLIPSLAIATLMADPLRQELQRLAAHPGLLKEAVGPLELVFYRQPFVRYSAIDVLETKRLALPADWAKGKIVLIGVEGKGLYDLRATPAGGDRSGLEIHATALSNWLQRTWLLSLPAWGVFLLVALFSLVPVCFWDMRLPRVLGHWVLLIVGYSAGIALAFHFVPVRMPWTAPILAFTAAAFARLADTVRREYSLRRHLEELQQMRQMLSNMLLHDLNAPLAGMTMLIESVLPQQPAGSKGRQRLEDALAEGSRLSSLLRTVLDIQRMESGRMQLTPTSFDWNRLVAATVERLAQRAAQRSLQIEISSDKPSVEVLGDAALLERVLLNLLGNAVQYASENTVIVCRTVLSSTPDECLTCSVTNHGPVLTPADQERIFEPFMRAVSGHRSTAHAGFGLGLAFCKLAVLAHGGKLSCKSPVFNETEGVSMEFSIPLKQRERKVPVAAKG
jgi:signal transduction histidine kinase